MLETPPMNTPEHEKRALLMNKSVAYRYARILGRAIVVAGIAGFIVYRTKFAPVSVIGYSVGKGDVVAEAMGTGTVGVRTRAVIGSRIQGRVVELGADQNDRVSKGQMLVRLDDSDLARQAEMAEAGLAATRATLERVRADGDRAKAVLDQARLSNRRFEELRAAQSVSQSDLDKSLEGLRVAEADVARAKAAVEEAVRQVETAEKTVAYRKALVDETRIASPFDGLIVRRDREIGDIVVPGAPVFDLIDPQVVWVSAWVDESRMAEIRRDQPARIVFRSEPEVEYPGRVARVGREVDRETREYVVDVFVDRLPSAWALGQRADVHIRTGSRRDVVVVPPRYVTWVEGGAGVFREIDGVARWTPVETGIRGREGLEILGGLGIGDVVFAPPVSKPGVSPRSIEGRRVVVR